MAQAGQEVTTRTSTTTVRGSAQSSTLESALRRAPVGTLTCASTAVAPMLAFNARITASPGNSRYHQRLQHLRGVAVAVAAAATGDKEAAARRISSVGIGPSSSRAVGQLRPLTVRPRIGWPGLARLEIQHPLAFTKTTEIPSVQLASYICSRALVTRAHRSQMSWANLGFIVSTWTLRILTGQTKTYWTIEFGSNMNISYSQRLSVAWQALRVGPSPGLESIDLGLPFYGQLIRPPESI